MIVNTGVIFPKLTSWWQTVLNEVEPLSCMNKTVSKIAITR